MNPFGQSPVSTASAVFGQKYARRMLAPSTSHFLLVLLIVIGVILLLTNIAIMWHHTITSITHHGDPRFMVPNFVENRLNTPGYTNDPRFFPFVMRDARKLSPVRVDHQFHVFDYVDVSVAKQESQHAQLFLDGVLLSDHEEVPCQEYSLECYKKKILQIFTILLQKFPRVEYFFYIEADTDLCVTMAMVKDLALTERRYFISLGIGASGWIMSREFMVNFLEIYRAPDASEIRPDVVASLHLIEQDSWAVTRQYWTSHTTLESRGSNALTVGTSDGKHLPRCLEPRRAKWPINDLDPRDEFGWDFFDYKSCPDAMIFPCGGKKQLKELRENDERVRDENRKKAMETLELEAAKQVQGNAPNIQVLSVQIQIPSQK